MMTVAQAHLISGTHNASDSELREACARLSGARETARNAAALVALQNRVAKLPPEHPERMVEAVKEFRANAGT